MTNPLKKALRGAATAGAELSMENHRANIQAKRDLALQKYQTSERVAGQEHDIALKKMDHELGGGGTQGDIQLMEYFQKHGIAANADEALSLVREMDTDPSKVIIDIAKSMHAVDPDKPFDFYLKQAESDVKALRERISPKKTQPAVEPQPAGGPLKPKRGGGLIESAIEQAQVSQGESPVAEAPKPVSLPPANERQVGKEYMTPRGRAIWRQGGWELVNAAE